MDILEYLLAILMLSNVIFGLSAKTSNLQEVTVSLEISKWLSV